MWYEGIKNATELSFMITRSRSKQIKYDISKIYKLYNNQQDDIILKEIVKFTNCLLNISLTRDFIKKFQHIVKEFEYFSDAFYSYKPFLSALYQYWVMNFHKNIREKMNNFWNEKVDLMKPFEILEIIETF